MFLFSFDNGSRGGVVRLNLQVDPTGSRVGGLKTLNRSIFFGRANEHTH